MNKNTIYLINKEQADGSMRLTQVSGKEWYGVTQENKGLPLAQRRYFVDMTIVDGDTLDSVVMETTRSDYLAWHRDHMSAARNRVYGEKMFDFISLDAPVPAHEDRDGGTVVDIPDAEFDMTRVDALVDLERVRKKLAKWKPWANDVLDLLLDDRRQDCTAVLSAKYSVSEQMARRYRKQAEDFILSLLVDAV